MEYECENCFEEVTIYSQTLNQLKYCPACGSKKLKAIDEEELYDDDDLREPLEV